jgi:hypothetical protein
MANTVKGNCIIVDSANQFLMPAVSTGDGKSGAGIFLKGITLAMTNTATAMMQIGCGDTLGASVVFQLDQITPSMSFDGLWMDNLIVTTISNGTGFIYFA